MGVSMVMIYQTAAQEIAEQIDLRIYAESTRLERTIEYRANMGLPPPAIGITERISTEPNMSFCIIATGDIQETLARVNQQGRIIDASFSELCHVRNPSQNSTNDPLKLMRVTILPVLSDYSLVIGYNTKNEKNLLDNMSRMVYLMTSILLLASFFGSFFMSRTIVHSTARISRTARRIVDGDFSERIRTNHNDSDELNRLAKDLNHMLDRIENLITSQRQVTNNIAHDLRSPLNRLRNRMEVALLDVKTPCAELREVIASSIEDADNLLRTFNALLNIAQVESRARDDFEIINLTTICEDLAELYEVLTEDGEHQFTSDISDNLQLMGNRHLLAQAITNLLDNAVKYTPKGGTICLIAKIINKDILISVTDNGHGIPSDKRNDVLKRFYRLDSARSTPGNGLGLALVSAVVNLHGGAIELQDNQPGLIVNLLLPNVEKFKARLSNQSISNHQDSTQ